MRPLAVESHRIPPIPAKQALKRKPPKGGIAKSRERKGQSTLARPKTRRRETWRQAGKQ